MTLPSSIEPMAAARVTREQYDALVASGALAELKVELLQGRVVEMSPQGIAHAGTVELLAELLRRGLGARARVREEKPFAAGEDAEPEPDIAVVPPGDPLAELPSRAFLVVEVADTSLAKDRGTKAATYATAGVPEYWIVNLVERVVEIHVEPTAGRYERITVVGRGESITLRVFPDVRLDVARILP